MFKAYKYRLYPTKTQQILLNKHFGCVRLVYNLALETKQQAYKGNKKNLSAFDLIYQLPDLKEGFPFLKEVSNAALQTSCLNMGKAYDSFFKHGASFPKYKSKRNRQSFQLPQKVEVNFESGKTYLPKFREGIKTVFERTFKGTIKTTTVSKTPTGKYFVSILVDTNKPIPEKKPIDIKTAVGIDLGIKTFAVLSDGTEYENPKYLRNSLKRLKVLSRRASKKVRGSSNQKKAYRRVAVLHEKVTNQRKDFLHKLSDAITKQYNTICIEDLKVSNMVKNHKLALSINDAAWGMFGTFLKYKSEWRGNNLLEIGTFKPSSKMHNKCGYINNDLKLSDRVWTCAKCGDLVDRDKNASLNILDWGIIKTGTGSAGEPVEMSALVESVKQEYLEIVTINE